MSRGTIAYRGVRGARAAGARRGARRTGEPRPGRRPLAGPRPGRGAAASGRPSGWPAASRWSAPASSTGSPRWARTCAVRSPCSAADPGAVLALGVQPPARRSPSGPRPGLLAARRDGGDDGAHPARAAPPLRPARRARHTVARGARRPRARPRRARRLLPAGPALPPGALGGHAAGARRRPRSSPCSPTSAPTCASATTSSCCRSSRGGRPRPFVRGMVCAQFAVAALIEMRADDVAAAHPTGGAGVRAAHGRGRARGGARLVRHRARPPPRRITAPPAPLPRRAVGAGPARRGRPGRAAAGAARLLSGVARPTRRRRGTRRTYPDACATGVQSARAGPSVDIRPGGSGRGRGRRSRRGLTAAPVLGRDRATRGGWPPARPQGQYRGSSWRTDRRTRSARALAFAREGADVLISLPARGGEGRAGDGPARRGPAARPSRSPATWSRGHVPRRCSGPSRRPGASTCWSATRTPDAAPVATRNHHRAARPGQDNLYALWLWKAVLPPSAGWRITDPVAAAGVQRPRRGAAAARGRASPRMDRAVLDRWSRRTGPLGQPHDAAGSAPCASASDAVLASGGVNQPSARCAARSGNRGSSTTGADVRPIGSGTRYEPGDGAPCAPAVLRARSRAPGVPCRSTAASRARPAAGSPARRGRPQRPARRSAGT